MLSRLGFRSVLYYRCVRVFRRHLLILKELGVVPVVVFDGLPLPAKASEQQRRKM